MSAVLGGTVTILGAGGPVGAAAALRLQHEYVLRLTDLLAYDEIPIPKDANQPHPPRLAPPHSWRQTDITDYAQVLQAVQGADAAINTSVMRHDPRQAFGVNMIGAYNLAKAAAAAAVKRIIHTGPWHCFTGFEGDHQYTTDIPDETPMHAGTNLYALTKLLGSQVCRAFAETGSIEVLSFLFAGFRRGDGGTAADGSGIGPMVISWEDTGEVIRCGLRAGQLPNPHEVFTMTARLPHGRYSCTKAERLLGWVPRHNFERLYTITDV